MRKRRILKEEEKKAGDIGVLINLISTDAIKNKLRIVNTPGEFEDIIQALVDNMTELPLDQFQSQLKSSVLKIIAPKEEVEDKVEIEDEETVELQESIRKILYKNL